MAPSPRLPTIQQLRCFVAVAQEMSFRRAATRLGMSQPPLSRQIKELENVLGFRLLDRSTHHVSLTAAGEVFVEDSRRILNMLASSIAGIGDAEDELGRQVKVGLSFMFDFTALPILREVLDQMGDSVVIQREYGASRNLASLVDSGELDVAIIGAYRDTPESIERLQIFTETIRVALPAHHPAAQKDSVTFKDFENLPLFWFSKNENPHYAEIFEQVFAKHGYRPPRLREPDDHVQLLSRIGAGEGATFLPTLRTSVRHPNVVYRSLVPGICDQLQVPIYVIWRDRGARPEVRHLIEGFKRHTSG